MQTSRSSFITKISLALLVAALLGGCSTFYEKHATPAEAALASTRQQLARKNYRVQSVTKLEDVQASESLSKTIKALIDSPDKDETASKTAKTTLDMAKAALSTVTGDKTGAADADDEADSPADEDSADAQTASPATVEDNAADKAVTTAKQKTDSDSDDWLADIAADNRSNKARVGSMMGNFGRGYLHLLRDMQFYSDKAVGSNGKTEYVTGVRYASRTVNYNYQIPFLVDKRTQQLYWDADQMSILMNPVVLEKPVRIDLKPLLKVADVGRLYALWRGQHAYALEHTDAKLFSYEPLETGADAVPNAYKKIRYQTPLRTALLNYRGYIEAKQGDIADAFRDEKTRDSVRKGVELLLTSTKEADKKADAPKTQGDADKDPQAQAQAQKDKLGDEADAAWVAAIADDPAQPEEKKGTFGQMVDNSLDKSTITDWLWLDRQGQLLRADTLKELHLGNDEDWIKVKLKTRKTYGEVPSAPLTAIQPEQAVSLREAVKGSLAGYLLASIHDLTKKKSSKQVSTEGEAKADPGGDVAAEGETAAEAAAAKSARPKRKSRR